MIHEYRVSSIAFSPDGRYVVSGGDRTARVWSVITGREIARATHESGTDSTSFNRNGRYVLSAGGENVRVWEAHTGREIALLSHEEFVHSAAFSPDGKYVVTFEVNGDVARVWDVISKQEIARMKHEAPLSFASFSPDSKYIVSASRGQIARVWTYLPGDAIFDACQRVTRNLTRAEWSLYVADLLPFQAVCPSLTIEPDPENITTVLPSLVPTRVPAP
jgi:WD40 repeat protein